MLLSLCCLHRDAFAASGNSSLAIFIPSPPDSVAVRYISNGLAIFMDAECKLGRAEIAFNSRDANALVKDAEGELAKSSGEIVAAAALIDPRLMLMHENTEAVRDAAAAMHRAGAETIPNSYQSLVLFLGAVFKNESVGLEDVTFSDEPHEFNAALRRVSNLRIGAEELYVAVATLSLRPNSS